MVTVTAFDFFWNQGTWEFKQFVLLLGAGGTSQLTKPPSLPLEPRAHCGSTTYGGISTNQGKVGVGWPRSTRLAVRTHQIGKVPWHRQHGGAWRVRNVLWSPGAGSLHTPWLPHELRKDLTSCCLSPLWKNSLGQTSAVMIRVLASWGDS